MPIRRPIAAIEQDVENWIDRSTQVFNNTFRDASRKIWVLKFIPARFLEQFLRTPQLAVSATPGFTWGDGVYVVPIDFAYSAMIYGRIGIMGWIGPDDTKRIYDGSQQRGIELYQEWISHKSFLYRLLTTTIHADNANRLLRNMFKRRFQIDLVYFPPDQYNRAYVAPLRDRWFVLSDWLGLGPQAPGQRPAFSPKVRECEWVALVGEEFDESTWKTQFRDLVGPHLTPMGLPRVAINRLSLAAQLHTQYRNNRSRGPKPPTVINIQP